LNVPITMTVNGEERRAEVEPRTLLVGFLREQLGLTGTHIGCETGQCGACTVLLDGQAVKSCTILAVQVDGQTVTTIEGLTPSRASAADQNGDDPAAIRLHPIQQAFWEEHGLQCGYCTPGVILSTHALLQENPHPDEAQIRHALEGNICRCTGYHNIVRAVQAAAGRLAEGGG